MFVMTNDGGLLDRSKNRSAERILGQRLFLFDLLGAGLAVTMLQGAEFRDSKVSCTICLNRQAMTNALDRYFRLSTNRGLMGKLNAFSHPNLK
jgi:hypothetical protein